MYSLNYVHKVELAIVEEHFGDYVMVTKNVYYVTFVAQGLSRTTSRSEVCLSVILITRYHECVFYW